MQKFKTLSDAIALAEFAHRNQTDKAGLPYIEHPRRVMQKVQAMGGLPFVQMAAILHDVTEDTAFTPEILLDLGFSEATVNLVMLLDRDESKKIWDNLTFEEWDVSGCRNPDDFYYKRIKSDPNAKMIKLADIEDNLSPWRLSYLSDETQARLQTKYANAKETLS